jgi:hypothetical protein
VKHRNNHLIFAGVALICAVFLVFYFNQQPGYTDAYYHYNAAVKIASGEGFVDKYLWTYIGAPARLPAPSHLYWMPGTSIIASLGMMLFDVTFNGAQIALLVCLWAGAILGYWLGYRQDNSLRYAWVVGLVTLFSGFYARFWGTTDTFTPYLIFGGGTLAMMGYAMQATQRNLRWWFLAGMLAGFAHLVRTDGLLMLLVGWWILLIYFERSLKQRLIWILGFTLGYLLVMTPWFLRNLSEIGTILPTGGTQAIWYTHYDDLFNFPPDASPQTFFADGVGLLINSRLEALLSNLQHLIAVEGFIVLTPFMLWGLWRKRNELFWRGVFWFTIGIHLAFTLVFPFPGARGGLFHATVALLPFWVMLGLLGMDASIRWLGKYRRAWRNPTPLYIFSSMVVLLAMWLTFSTQRTLLNRPPVYDEFMRVIPPNTRVMRNDMPEMYYYTGIGGVVLANESVDVLREIAELYNIDYLIIEYPNVPANVDLEPLPDFLKPVPFSGGVEIYEIQHRP